MTTSTIETKEDLQVAILSQLGTGEENAIHAKSLAQRLGFKEDRPLREMIVKMRHSGVRIIGSKKGYYLAKETQDIVEAREYLKKYVLNLCRDMADYKRLLNQVNGQLKMRLER